jgi:tetratricopeptide (TPR) repeat protein
MKYPHLPPVGDPAGGPGWVEAGSDLVSAAALLGRREGSVRVDLQRAEVLRRQGHGPQARAVLLALRPKVAEAPLVALALANSHWTQGDAVSAREPYEQALAAWTEAGDADGILAARIGLCRCERMNYDKSGLGLLGTAVAAAEGVTDVHVLADLHREQAAWALLTGDSDAALGFAEQAAAVHASVEDRYLQGLADVLRARALNSQHERSLAVELMRRQVDVAITIGSAELKMVAVVYLGQFLQRGVVIGTPEWSAAKEVLDDALEDCDDPFTRAELLLPLAHLYTNSGQFDEAQRCLDEYGTLYQALGGNKIAVANLIKASARLDLARHGGMSLRSVRLNPVALAGLLKIRNDFRRAARAYRRAGLEPGARSARWHIELVDILGARRTKGARELPSEGRDALDRSRDNLLRAEFEARAGNLEEALAACRRAEAAAIEAGATTFAVAAASRSAEIALELGDHGQTVVHVRSAIDHAESIRAAVASGPARRHIAGTLRGHYEAALVLAATIGEADLVIEIAERLRTERLAGLLRRGRDALPADLTVVLSELDRVNDALLIHEPGVRGIRSAVASDDLAGRDIAGLRARHGELQAQLAERTTELFADTYGAEPVNMERVAAIDSHILMLIPVSHQDHDSIVVVWRAPTGESHCTITPVDDGLARLRTVLTHRDYLDRLNLTEQHLAPLRALLPQAFLACLETAVVPIKVVIVPTGWLWAVPFAAIPFHRDPGPGTLLLDRADTVLAPSLRFLCALTDRDTAAAAGSAVSWHDPASGFDAAELAGLGGHPGGHVRLAEARQVREAFVRGGATWRTAVLAAHGNREPGLAHAVLARGTGSVLTAADFLNGAARAPRYVSLASCHSGFPDGTDQHEPLGLALAALAAGASHVISAHFEIDATGELMTTSLQRLYEAMARTDDPPGALARVLRERVQYAPVTRPLLYQWAALTVIGTH